MNISAIPHRDLSLTRAHRSFLGQSQLVELQYISPPQSITSTRLYPQLNSILNLTPSSTHRSIVSSRLINRLTKLTQSLPSSIPDPHAASSIIDRSLPRDDHRRQSNRPHHLIDRIRRSSPIFLLRSARPARHKPYDDYLISQRHRPSRLILTRPMLGPPKTDTNSSLFNFYTDKDVLSPIKASFIHWDVLRLTSVLSPPRSHAHSVLRP